MTVIGFVLGFSGFVSAEDKGAVEKININTASAEELTQLKGVGNKLAAHIVAYREANGPYKTVQDLELVKGIGPKILADNADVLTVGAPVNPVPVPAPKL
ncbi:MAG: helix-hairpin-helix domain-containing protein [Desulfobacteraceae bacterium]|nr:MAG: helix-hairpin-helix domain-containing protein [Desulfobacteraceae bacterium]